MLARENSFQGYRDPEKAALLRAEHKRDRDGKTATREDSGERRPRASKKNKKPKTAKNRTTSNPVAKLKNIFKPKISCTCPPHLPPRPVYDDGCSQYDSECQVLQGQQSSSKEDVELEEKVETRVTTTPTREKEYEEDGERVYEQRERVRERNFKKKMDDTCSCASCVLKKMCHNDCICCCCVAFVFLLSLFLAFMLVCKSIPLFSSNFNMFAPVDEVEGDRLKRKINVPADMQWDGLDKTHRMSKKRDDERLPGHPVPHFLDPTTYGDINLSHESDLNKFIDSDKLNEIQTNTRLKEFYKKLVQTDREIRKLKKGYLFSTEHNSLPYPDRAKRSLDILKDPFRMFRPKKKKIKEVTEKGKTTEAAKVIKPNKEQEMKLKMNKTKEDKDERVKRFDTNEGGLLIDKKKISIHFVPNGQRTFKYSHAPKEINSDERRAKNPYQNTQRLDELLDRFLDKNDSDMIGEPYLRSMLTIKKKHKNLKIGAPATNNKTEKDKKVDSKVNSIYTFHPKNKKLKNSSRNNNNNKNVQHLSKADNFKSLDDQIANSKMLNEHYNKNSQQTNFDSLKEFLDSHGGAAMAKVKPNVQAKITTNKTSKEHNVIIGYTGSPTENYNLVMSISTMMYKEPLPYYDVDSINTLPAKNPDGTKWHEAKDRAPVAVGRRLLQTEMGDDEEVSVLAASEQDSWRKRIDMQLNREDINPNNIINRNWKGPMPLYPDELNAINNKPGPIIVAAKNTPDTEFRLFSGSKHSKKIKEFKPRGRSKNEDPTDLTDMEYIEDYFRNKYNKDAELAQAYSDYGLFDDKDIRQERVDQRFRNYVKVESDMKRPESTEKDLSMNYPAEGFTLQFPTGSRLDGAFKILKKHLKFTSVAPPEPTAATDADTTLDAFFADDTSFSTAKDTKVLDVKNILKVESPKGLGLEFRNVKKRSLKSVDDYRSEDPREDPSDAIESLMNFRGIFNGLQKKFSTKLGSAQDYAIRVASDYIHEGLYKRDVDSVDVDVADSTADDITVTDNTTDIYNTTDVVKLVANDTDDATAQTIETGVKIAIDVRNDTGTTLSDFFMKLAHWFSLLDTLDLSANKSQQGNISTTNTTEKSKDLPMFELSFPLYDADMIENIGHRSRVLLAVNETEAVVDSTPDGEGKAVVDTKGVGVVGTEINNTTTTNLETVNATDTKTKTIVKRNADGNLLWDDVYNDDYGSASKSVQSLGSKPEKKHPKDFFKKMVHRFMDAATKCEEPKPGCKVKEKGKPKPRKPKPKKLKSKLKSIQDLRAVALRRFYRKADEYPTEEKKTDFTILTAKMKKICQKAAKDISLSKKLEVHEKSQEGQVAANLMQQLVGLMSDLVDYQVHEKTCRKLPRDLQNFLEWLTNPDSTVMTYHGKDVRLAQSNKGMPHEELVEEMQTLEPMPSAEEDQDPKSCFSVMSAVRDLLNRYDTLSDEDKSKMSGVKEYLEAQMEYLQKQMYLTTDYNLLNPDISRYKREAKVSVYRPSKAKSVYVTFRKYMRKQHKHGDNLTKNLYVSDNESTTSKVMTIAVEVEKVRDNVKPEKDVVKKETKRNLKDVYYRALEEVTKLVTATTVEAKLTTALSPKTTDY